MNTLTIREATEADIHAIVALLTDDAIGETRERPGDPAYREAFARMATQEGNIELVAERDGTVVGCLQLTMIAGLSRAGQMRAQIEGVRVATSARGEGVGEAMVRDALARAEEAGCALAQLTTDVRRADAKRFYERLGFEATHWGMKRALSPARSLSAT